MNQSPHSADEQTSANGSSEPMSGVSVAIQAAPANGTAIEVATGVWWARLPLAANVGHVNVYLLEDERGWTLVDTGTNSEGCRSALQAILSSEHFARRLLVQVVATHYHPDHIGLAGELAGAGAQLLTTRQTWLFARTIQLDSRDLPTSEQVQFAQRAGLKGPIFEAYCRRPSSDYRTLVTPLPLTYVRLQDGDVLTIGPRSWRVIVGHGHAAEHATLWSDDGLALTGDQILPGIASNLSVPPSEPDSDLVSEWMESCQRLILFGDDQTLCLPGHNLPFTGAVTRCHQLLAMQDAVLNRLLEFLSRPRTAVECLPILYRRHLQLHELASLIPEAVGFLNHLRKRELVRRELAPDDSYLWQVAARSR